jgi:integrase
MEDAHRSEHLTPKARAIVFRDGLMVALLALRPLRRGNFAGVRLGQHLHKTPTGYRIEIPSEESKTGQLLETTIPEDLLPWLDQYLHLYRPILLGGAVNEHLWVSKKGRAYSPKHLGERITRITRRLVGVAVNPHLFRDCAATTIATVDPEHVRMVMSLLGHKTPLTAERYYNHARSLEAGRAHQENIRQLRERLRPLRRRTTQKAGR